MITKKSILLGTVSGVAAVTSAYPADMPVKARPPVPVVTPSWTGFYIGVHAGVVWERADNSADLYTGSNYEPYSVSTKHTGFIGGGQIGYNWQTNGNWLLGLEADISGLTGSGNYDDGDVFATNEIKWLGTVRGRLGWIFGNDTLLYATGGLAYGKVHNVTGDVGCCNGGGDNRDIWELNKVLFGYTVGGGIEHIFAPRWTARLEGLFVDLGHSHQDVNTEGFNTFSDNGSRATFSNKAVILRAAINYKFYP